MLLQTKLLLIQARFQLFLYSLVGCASHRTARTSFAKHLNWSTAIFSMTYVEFIGLPPPKAQPKTGNCTLRWQQIVSN